MEVRRWCQRWRRRKHSLVSMITCMKVFHLSCLNLFFAISRTNSKMAEKIKMADLSDKMADLLHLRR